MKKIAKPDFHKKIAKARGARWKQNMLAGRREAQISPSLIRLARLAKDIEQTTLAIKMKVSASTFGSIERGRRPVSLTDATKIASHLGMTRSKLFREMAKDKFVAVIQKSGL